MTSPRVAMLLLISMLLAACSSAIPESAQSSPNESAPQPMPSVHTKHVLQLGIDIDFYTSAGTNVAPAAQQDVSYIKGLHANAVSISFPFYTNRVGTVVGPLPATPSVTQLGTLINTARAAGLTVTVRPLLNESALGESRVHWKPRRLSTWFNAYQHFLLPYAALAQHDHVAMFVVGTELSRFSASSEWMKLATAVHAVYHGKLAYSNNWIGVRNSAAGVVQTTDAYAPLPLPDSAPVSALAAGWKSWARTFPTGTILSEVGIASQSGAYAHPWEWGSSTAPIDPRIQARWFRAACQAVNADHLGGIYFWPLYFGQSLTVPEGTNGPTSWAATAGAAAISKCFAKLRAAA